MFNKLVLIFSNLTEPKTSTIDDGSRYWQEKILNLILFFSVIFGIPLYFIATILSISNNIYIVPIVFSMVIATILFLFGNRKVPYEIRSKIILMQPYVIGTFLLFNFGTDPIGFLWLFLHPILITILIKYSHSVIGVGINILTILGAALYYKNSGSIELHNIGYWTYWGMIAFNFSVLSLLSSLAMTILFKGLQTTITTKERAKKQYQRMYQNIPDVYFEIDTEGIIQSITPSSEQMLCMKSEHLLGLSLYSYFDETGKNQFIQEIKNEEFIHQLEVQITTCTTKNIICSINAQKIINIDGPDTIVGTLQNISRRKIMEIEKKDLDIRLNRAKKMESLGMMTGGVANDLNNILSAVVATPIFY